MKHQRPLLEESPLDVRLHAEDRLHDDIQGPHSTGHLSPGMSRHERPAVETVLVVIVIGPLAQDHRSDSMIID